MGFGAVNTATLERCKLAFIREETCDPDLSWFGQTWEWIKGNGVSVGVNCLEQQDKYYACVAGGIPPAPAPAPPPIQTSTAGWNDPTLPQQADDATRQRFEEWKQVLSQYFTPAGEGSDDGESPFGVPTNYLLYGAVGLAAVLLLTGRRR